MPTTSTPAVSDGATDVPFRWVDVPASDRDWLRKRTEDIETWAYRIGCDIARIGLALSEVRDKLEYGLFQRWVRAETPFSVSHSYRYIAVGKAFGAYISEIETIEPCALYILAHDKTPKAARDHALALAQQGEVITRKLALEIIDAEKPVRDLSKQELRVYDEERREREKLVIDGKKVDADRTTAKLERSDAAYYEALGRTIAELAKSRSLVSISTVDDPDDDTFFSITTHAYDHEVRNVVGKDLRQVADRIAGKSLMKHCRGCCKPGELIPTERFGMNKSNGDGLMSRCANCEKKRKHDDRQRAKAEPSAFVPKVEEADRS